MVLQVAKLGPVSRAAGMDCECPLYSDSEMFSLESEVHHYIEILEPVLRDAGQEMWQALDRIISAKNAMEGHVAKEMYIRGFLDYERLVCEKDSYI